MYIVEFSGEKEYFIKTIFEHEALDAYYNAMDSGEYVRGALYKKVLLCNNQMKATCWKRIKHWRIVQ